MSETYSPPVVYDIIVDQYRAVTMDDVRRWQRVEEAYYKLRDGLKLAAEADYGLRQSFGWMGREHEWGVDSSAPIKTLIVNLPEEPTAIRDLCSRGPAVTDYDSIKAEMKRIKEAENG